jgi:PAS domain S-box-containing protein
MTLRSRLLLGFSLMVGALFALGGSSAWHLWQMSALSERIVAENYDSVVAARNMKESLERQDSAAMFVLLGEWDRAIAQVQEHRRGFDSAYQRAVGNVTEPGEADILQAMGTERDQYNRQLDQFVRDAKGGLSGAEAPAERVKREYFAQLEPLSATLRAQCDRLLNINQDAMRRKAAEAATLARRWFITTLGLAVTLVLCGSWYALFLSNRIVRPIRQVTDAASRMAAGELDATVDVRATDEIGVLAAGFNAMSARIRELRQSDLGKLLVAQQTAVATIDSLYDPVVVTDGAGRVQRINRAAEPLFGPAGAVLGKALLDIARDPRVSMAVTDVLESQQPVASEETSAIVPLVVDGVERSFRQRTTPLRDMKSELAGAVILLEDVTHLRELDRLKSEFIAGASHELRTPLTSLEMGVHLLLEGSMGALAPKQRELLEMCRDDALRLDRLVKELLDLSKIESGEAAPKRVALSPHDLLVEGVAPLRRQAEAKGLTLHVDAPSDLPDISADRGQIERVIANLVTNAIRATDAHGSIEIAAGLRADVVAISVRDTGRGIPAAYLDRIFEPFVQVPNAPAGAVGLGLAISRRIVQAHGGQLAVRSQVGQGTTFTFTLPLAARAAG